MDPKVAAQAAYDAVISAFQRTGDDSVLRAGDKAELIFTVETINLEVDSVEAHALTYGLDPSAYRAAHQAIKAGLPNGWDDQSTSTAVNAAVFRAMFTRYYVAKQTLLNEICAKAMSQAKFPYAGLVGVC